MSWPVNQYGAICSPGSISSSPPGHTDVGKESLLAIADKLSLATKMLPYASLPNRPELQYISAFAPDIHLLVQSTTTACPTTFNSDFPLHSPPRGSPPRNRKPLALHTHLASAYSPEPPRISVDVSAASLAARSGSRMTDPHDSGGFQLRRCVHIV